MEQGKYDIKKSSRYDLLLPYLSLFLLYSCLSVIYQGYTGDMNCWRLWATHHLKYGVGHAYESGTDYLPLYHYVLFIFAKIQGSPEAIANHIYQLRYFTLFVEFIAGFFLLKLTYDKYKNPDQSVVYTMFYFANIFMFYNTVVWGQIDGIQAGLVFISFFFAYKQKIGWSVSFYVLAVNLKLQAIVFLPVIGLMLLPVVADRFSLKNLMQWLAFPIYIQFFILVPFIVAGDTDKLRAVVIESVGKYPMVSMNAFNIWYLLLGDDLMNTSDTWTFGGISYHRWGLWMFFISSFFALFYLLKINYQRIRNIKNTLSLEKTLIIAGLIPLLFFYFNTQMHKRYAHPALIFTAGYAVLSKHFFPFVMLSIAYFINLEAVLNQFHLFGFDYIRELCSVLYLIVIILLFIELYENPSKKKRLFLYSLARRNSDCVEVKEAVSKQGIEK